MSASRITDAAVEAISRNLIGDAWDTFDGGLRETLRGIHREGLEAAEPHLTPALPSLEQIIIALHNDQHGEKQCVQGNCRKRDIAARLAPSVLALLNGSES